MKTVKKSPCHLLGLEAIGSSTSALTTRHKLNQRLQSAFPRGTPFDHQELGETGHFLGPGASLFEVGPQLARQLGRGVFMFPHDTLHRDDCLKFLSRREKGFHVGGKTALAWRGVRHNLPVRESLSLPGRREDPVSRMVSEIVSGALYDPESVFLPAAKKFRPAAAARNNRTGCLVSVPERALLEMLSEVRGSSGDRGGPQYHGRGEVAATGSAGHAGHELPARQCGAALGDLGRGIESALGSRGEKARRGKSPGRGRWTTRLKDGTLLVLKS